MCSPPGLVDSDTARNKVIETIDQCVKRDVNIRGHAQNLKLQLKMSICKSCKEVLGKDAYIYDLHAEKISRCASLFK